ncbi:MAG: hypothetical protein AAF944_01250 [Bacteroidota bacterium]
MLSIPPETQYTIEGCPFYTTPDGHSETILVISNKRTRGALLSCNQDSTGYGDRMY